VVYSFVLDIEMIKDKKATTVVAKRVGIFAYLTGLFTFNMYN
jgi:hypothetical protein